MNLFRKHWKKIAGVVVAIAGWFVPGAQALIPVGALVLGSDFQVGANLGTPIGKSAKDVAAEFQTVQKLKLLEAGSLAGVAAKLR